MRSLLLFVIFAFWGMRAFGHEFTPAYPKLESAYIDGVLVAKMQLFNHRQDVTFYELSVFDANWNSVPFAASDKLVEVVYLQRKYIEIYIREKDRDRVVYICSKSKLNPIGEQVTIVSSRICSKVK